ncbi:P-II family nitrogen regulator [Nitrospira sp. BLG_2]|uniref:P-II family nitrogen regulator n=1 Tax=Nitrospira sp. BLG_2 TaxID=3397507 RepID=UPI003B9D72A6
MKMLVIVFRESLVEQVHALLNDYEVSAFSELHNVAGKGATDPTSQFFLAPTTNRMILTAVSEQLAYRLIDAFSHFRSKEEAAKGDSVFPLHVFLLPCEQMV